MGVNTYTALPNIIPGTLTVQGDLLVNGRTIRLGTSTRKLRIQEKVLNDVFQLSFNRDVVAGIGDDPGGLTIGWLMGSGVAFFRLLSGSFGADPSVVRLDDTSGQFAVVEDILRVGAASPFTRLGKVSGDTSRLTHNIDLGLNALDDATRAAAWIALFGSTLFGDVELAVSSVGGIQQRRREKLVVTRDNTVTTRTGSTVEAVIRSYPFAAGELGQNGGASIAVLLFGNAQGGVASTFRMKLGGTSVFSFTRTAVATILWLVNFDNQNLTNSQRWRQLRFDAAAVGAQSDATSALETNLAQTLEFTIQLGAAGDSWDTRAWLVERRAARPQV